jgi:hypothetical protein
MFSTILTEVTSYFDRRALVSAFFPSLFFWGLIVTIVSIQYVGWNNVLARWQELSGTAQFLLLIIFFAWISFWTFLTLIFRTTIVRLYEGYWIQFGSFSRLFEWRLSHWQEQFEKLTHLYDELQIQQMSPLYNEKIAYDKLISSLKDDAHSSSITDQNHIKLQACKESVIAFAKGMKLDGKEFTAESLTGKLVEISMRVRQDWQNLKSPAILQEIEHLKCVTLHTYLSCFTLYFHTSYSSK